MISRKIKIELYKDIKEFVELAEKYGDRLIIKGVKCEFPACSLMSVMSLVDLSESVKIQFDESLLNDIITDFGKWILEGQTW